MCFIPYLTQYLQAPRWTMWSFLFGEQYSPNRRRDVYRYILPISFFKSFAGKSIISKTEPAKFSSIHTTFSEHQLCTEHYSGCQRHNIEQGGHGPCCQAYILEGGRQALNNKPTRRGKQSAVRKSAWRVVTQDLPEEVTTHVELGMLESHTS